MTRAPFGALLPYRLNFATVIFQVVVPHVFGHCVEVVVHGENETWDEGTKNGPDRSALLGHNFVYQETKPHGFYSSYFHQRISS